MCSSVYLIFRLFYYSLFAWIIGQVKAVLDRFYDKLLNPIRTRVPVLRIGMAGIDLSPLILIFGFNFIQPYILRFVC